MVENKIYLFIFDFFMSSLKNLDRFPAERNQQDNKVSKVSSVAWAFLKLSRL